MASNDYLDDGELFFLKPSLYPAKIFEEEENRDIEYPEDFVERIGTKIVIYCERQALLVESMEKIAKMLRTNLCVSQGFKIILEIFKYFEESDQLERFASITFNAIVHTGLTVAEGHKAYGKFIAWLVYSHNNRKYSNENDNRFGYIANALTELFLLISRNESDDFQYYTKFFTHLIRYELNELEIAQEKAKKRSPYILNMHDFWTEVGDPPPERCLFECILDNLFDLTQSESNEYSAYRKDREGLQMLERLENARSYAIQTLINEKAVAYNEMVKQEFRKKTLTPDELLNAENLFYKCIVLFRLEKRYNFKYIAVEDIRILSQLISIVIGFSVFVLTFVNWIDLSIFQGVCIFLLMLVHGSLLFTRKSIHGFYPEDQSPKLEFEISNFAEYFKKMSPVQMEKFICDRIVDKDYEIHYTYIPDFVNYIYGLIRNKELVITNQDEVVAIVQKAEIMANRKMAGLD